MTHETGSDTAREAVGTPLLVGAIQPSVSAASSPSPDATQELTVSDIVEVAAALGSARATSPTLPPRASTPPPLPVRATSPTLPPRASTPPPLPVRATSPTLPPRASTPPPLPVRATSPTLPPRATAPTLPPRASTPPPLPVRATSPSHPPAPAPKIAITPPPPATEPNAVDMSSSWLVSDATDEVAAIAPPPPDPAPAEIAARAVESGGSATAAPPMEADVTAPYPASGPPFDADTEMPASLAPVAVDPSPTSGGRPATSPSIARRRPRSAPVARYAVGFAFAALVLAAAAAGVRAKRTPATLAVAVLTKAPVPAALPTTDVTPVAAPSADEPKVDPAPPPAPKVDPAPPAPAKASAPKTEVTSAAPTSEGQALSARRAAKPKTGTVRFSRASGDVYVDGVRLTASPATVTCGKHWVKVGSAVGRTVDVPCGGATSL